MRSTRLTRSFLAAALLAVLLPVAVLWAGVDAPSAPPAARRLGLNQKILQRFDVAGTGYETVIMRVEFPADYEVTRHSHPGPQGL